MFMDKELMFAEEQSIAATVGDVLSENVIDLGGPDKGDGEPLEVYVQIDTSVDSAADGASVQFKLQTADALSGDNLDSPTDMIMTAALAEADLTAGTLVHLGRVPGGAKRYLQLCATLSGEEVTAGAITAGLVRSKQTNFAQ